MRNRNISRLSKFTTCYIRRIMFLSKENEHYNLLDYFDRRKSTNLTRFQYCPICGELLNYKELKRKANEIINSRL